MRLYESRGFTVVNIIADGEFESIRAEFPHVNTTGEDDHVPEIERRPNCQESYSQWLPNAAFPTYTEKTMANTIPLLEMTRQQRANTTTFTTNRTTIMNTSHTNESDNDSLQRENASENEP
mmetsp:Transcript_22126/g.61494  ORF Transcript_22126/g.61494 Transcript_22126/m.61494 type:complete len:121 (-) Transcript_22126:192-554(-)